MDVFMLCKYTCIHAKQRIKYNGFLASSHNCTIFVRKLPHDMRKLLFFALAALLFSACQESLEDRAAREAQDYNRKYCPQQVDENSRLDSFTFDKSSHTFVRYFTIVTDSQSAQRAQEKAVEIRNALVEEVRNDMNMRIFKEKGYSFRFVARSDQDSALVLYDATITQNDYQPKQ